MLGKTTTEAGTIRDSNQDYVLDGSDRGYFILADGSGLEGRSVAEEIARRLAEKLLTIRLQASVEASADRISRAVLECNQLVTDWQVNRPGHQSSSVNLALACVVEGKLFLGATNTCGILGLIRNQTIKIPPRGLPRIPCEPAMHGPRGSDRPEVARYGTNSVPSGDDGREFTVFTEGGTVSTFEPAISILGPLDFQVGDWIMLFSEGLLMSQPLDELEELVPAVHQEADDFTDGIFRRASQRYEGDDRTLAFLRMVPPDLKGLLSDDTVISTEIDRTYSFPVWGALLVMLMGCLLSLLLDRLPDFPGAGDDADEDS
jgi:hypothetical protein